MDRLLEKTKRALSDSGFAVEGEPEPDQAHFGNWILIATLGTVTVRITMDRGDIILDLTPRFLFREGASEDSWYTWDVVAKALTLKARTAEEMLELASDDHVQQAFNHLAWKDRTLPSIRLTEEDKRRRFMEGLNVRADYAKIGGERTMANEDKIYVEKRSDGRYAVRRGNSERASAITDTQEQAIERARELNPGHSPHVERVRDTEKGGRDKWRKP